jgi:uncharacterized protein (TIGR03435 family)
MELNISFASKAASAGERNVSFAIGGWPDFAVAARKLSPFAGRPVQDETGLSGAFDFQLTWTPDPGESRADGDKVKAAGIPSIPLALRSSPQSKSNSE